MQGRSHPLLMFMQFRLLSLIFAFTSYCCFASSDNQCFVSSSNNQTDTDSQELLIIEEIDDALAQDVLHFYFLIHSYEHEDLPLESDPSKPKALPMPASVTQGDSQITSYKASHALIPKAGPTISEEAHSQFTDLVLSYLEHRSNFSSHIRHKKNHINFHKVARRGARLLTKSWELGTTLGAVSSNALLSRLSPYFLGITGVSEKILDLSLAQTDIDKAKKRHEQLSKEFLEAFEDSMHQTELDHRTAHYKKRVRQILQQKLDNFKLELENSEGQLIFVAARSIMDLARLCNEKFPDRFRFVLDKLALISLDDEHSLNKIFSMSYKIVSVILVERFVIKAKSTCSPLVKALLKQFHEQKAGPLSEMEQLLLDSIAANQASLASDSVKCALILAKLGALIYGQVSSPAFFGLPIPKNELVTGLNDITNTGTNLLLELLPKHSYSEQINTLVNALIASFDLNDSSMKHSPIVQNALDLLKTLPGPKEPTRTIVQVRSAIAKKLIVIDSRLFCFIILEGLISDNDLGLQKTQDFLLNLGIPLNDIKEWTDLATYFGSDHNIPNQLLLNALRLTGSR